MALDLIRAHFPALEAAVEEDDGEVELTLGLSIGGSSRKAPRAGAAPQGPAADAGSCEAEADLGGSGSSPSSSPPPLPFLHVDGEDALDQMRPREIHALRRREARRKRDEKKQQKRGICGAAPAAAAPGLCGVFPPLERTCSSDDRLSMDAREHQMRVKDREARVEEALDCVPNHKLGANHNPNPNADANFNPSFNPNYSNPNLVPFGAQSFPMVAMQYSYPHLQYVPITNGFGIPCVMPCWSPAVSPVAEGPRTERNVFQPVTCRAFQPFPPPVVGLNDGGLPLISNAVESDDGNGTGVERAPSWTASHGSSSSPAASDHRSGSLRGGSSSSSSSDRRSHSSRTQGKLQPQPSLQEGSRLPVGPSDNISSRQIDADLNAVGEPPSGRRPSPCANRSPPANKPVRTEPPSQQASPPQLPRMPCVSATGNGPNGKKITGVLYRYTKTEVSIVCACHGSSFSPAEFVEHAGGTDVTHPLRQITVVSS